VILEISISIGDMVAVAIEDETEPNLEALESVLRRAGDEALRLHQAIMTGPKVDG
jgi:hypothetical protein